MKTISLEVFDKELIVITEPIFRWFGLSIKTKGKKVMRYVSIGKSIFNIDAISSLYVIDEKREQRYSFGDRYEEWNDLDVFGIIILNNGNSYYIEVKDVLYLHAKYKIPIDNKLYKTINKFLDKEVKK